MELHEDGKLDLRSVQIVVLTCILGILACGGLEVRYISILNSPQTGSHMKCTF